MNAIADEALLHLQAASDIDSVSIGASEGCNTDEIVFETSRYRPLTPSELSEHWAWANGEDEEEEEEELRKQWDLLMSLPENAACSSTAKIEPPAPASPTVQNSPPLDTRTWQSCRKASSLFETPAPLDRSTAPHSSSRRRRDIDRGRAPDGTLGLSGVGTQSQSFQGVDEVTPSPCLLDFQATARPSVVKRMGRHSSTSALTPSSHHMPKQSGSVSTLQASRSCSILPPLSTNAAYSSKTEVVAPYSSKSTSAGLVTRGMRMAVTASRRHAVAFGV